MLIKKKKKKKSPNLRIGSCWHDAPHVKPVLGQRARLVEADCINCPTQIDGSWRDAVHAVRLEAVLGEDDANRHGGRQRGWDDYGDKVQGTEDDRLHVVLALNLEAKKLLSIFCHNVFEIFFL